MASMIMIILPRPIMLGINKGNCRLRGYLALLAYLLDHYEVVKSNCVHELKSIFDV
jgi:hypothetical protein